MGAAKKFDLKAAIHGERCACAAHANKAMPGASGARPPSKIGWLATIAPVFACAFCPACLSVWVPALASAGLAISWTESDHHVLLAISVIASVALAGWRAWRTGRALPLGLAILGCTALVGAHLAGESLALTIVGAAILIASPFVERTRWAAAPRRA